MSIPSLELKNPNSRFLILDSDQASVVPGPPDPNQAQNLRFQASSLTTSQLPIQKVTLCSFVSKAPLYNICDFSAIPGGLKNNRILVNGIPVDIPVGNYTASTLATALQTLIDSVVGPGSSLVVYNDTTMLFQFGTINPYTIELPLLNSPDIELGLDKNVLYNAPVDSLYIPNLSGPSDILIYIDELCGGTPLCYDLQNFLFSFPLTNTMPGLSAMFPYLNSPKTQAFVSLSQRALNNLTVKLYFSRAGKIHPLFSPGVRSSGVVGGYSMILCFE